LTQTLNPRKKAMDDETAIIATFLKIEHSHGWELKSPLGILESKFTNQGYNIWKSENFQKKLMCNLHKLYYKPTKECWEDWVALEDCMNCIKVLCGIDDEDGWEEIYLHFDKNFSDIIITSKTSRCCPQLLEAFI
jgi:hypothetical protein